MYRLIFSQVLRRFDAEAVHHATIRTLRLISALRPVKRALHRRLAPRDPALRVTAFGVHFSTPFGLAAGFDKNAACVEALSAFGFGHVEVGTITAHAQPGNARPRLFRLAPQRAIINRMGFNNEGAARVARRLDRARGVPAIVGVNIGKTKVIPESAAVDDYVTSAKALAGRADYLVVNVSSPNTPGLRDLQATDRLRPLLAAVREVTEGGPRRTPLLVKIAPDLADDDVDAVADLAVELGLDGIVATNTTISRAGVPSAEPGGLSGRPLKARSLEVLRRLHARVGGKITLVSAGGVEDVDDVWERLLAGATLVQAYTAMIYEGPLWPRRINRSLSRRLRGHGHSSITEVIGKAARMRADHET